MFYLVFPSVFRIGIGFNADADPDPVFYVHGDPDGDLNQDPDPGFWWLKTEKMYSWKTFFYFINEKFKLSYP